MEIWQRVQQFKNYEVSNLGNIRNAITERILKIGVNSVGYANVCLYKKDIKKTLSVHRVVATAFLGEHPNMMVDHINCNKLDNKLENLRFVTNSENQRNRVKTPKGVYKSKRSLTKKWRTSVKIDNKEYYLGYFKTKKEALMIRQQFLLINLQ